MFRQIIHGADRVHLVESAPVLSFIALMGLAAAAMILIVVVGMTSL
jgi:hypothetical protein